MLNGVSIAGIVRSHMLTSPLANSYLFASKWFLISVAVQSIPAECASRVASMIASRMSMNGLRSSLFVESKNIRSSYLYKGQTGRTARLLSHPFPYIIAYFRRFVKGFLWKFCESFVKVLWKSRQFFYLSRAHPDSFLSKRAFQLATIFYLRYGY